MTMATTANSLIEQVRFHVNTPAITDDEILLFLNQAVGVITDELLLPGLDDGSSTLVALSGADQVALPDDYHKGLYLAVAMTVLGPRRLDIYLEKKSLDTAFGGSLQDDQGEISGVAAHAGVLLYRLVPYDDIDIQISYYRNPIPMTNADPASALDGFPGNTTYQNAVVNFACMKVFSRIEQGLEGSKSDTNRYRKEFDRDMDELRVACARIGENHREPGVTWTCWP
jgi:hypothetical protein